jgi:hypothetical protein
MFGDGRDPVSQQRYIEFRNVSGHDIPGFGVLQITGSEIAGVGRKILTVTRPDGTAGATFAINSNLPVAAGSSSYGVCTMSWPATAAYDTGDGTPTINQTWGPKSGQFTLAKGNPGFRIVGTAESGRVFVTCIPGDGYGRIKGLLVGAMETTDTTHTMDNIVVISGADPRTDPDDPDEAITFNNAHEWEADDNALVRVEYVPGQEHPDAYQVTCSASDPDPEEEE